MLHIHWTNDLREDIERRSMSEMYEDLSEPLNQLKINFKILIHKWSPSVYIERGQSCI